MPHERRVFSNAYFEENSVIYFDLSARDRHHLFRVLRLQSGDSVTIVYTPGSFSFTGTVTKKGDVYFITVPLELFRSASDTSSPSQKHPVDTLIFSLCKGDTNDFIAQKATELGVANIVFCTTDKSVPVIKSDQAEKKLQRWKNIAEGASKQSGRNSIPSIYIYPSIDELLTQYKGAFLLTASLEEHALPIQSLSPFTYPVNVLIGPEGDFSSSEYEKLKSSGSLFISLGNLRLRSETAAIAGIAMVQALSTVK